ncbi:MAG: alpha-2-macroglobulin, partial [Bacteroidales bacterium]|nr:alpha-2-macroglobulin [Bacteroidales bacterium]
VQAYRLYTLALAGSPDMGAMNRMRETDNVAVIAKWRLAAAYALSGKEEVAKGLVRDLETTVANYSAMNQTFGSSLRDRAMILETMSLLKDYERGAPLAINISKKLSSSQWLSTQTTAYCLLSMAKFSGDSQSVSDDLAFDYKINDQQKLSAKTQLPVAQINFDIPGVDNGAVTVENKSEGIIYVRIILEGIPVAGNEVFAEENLHIKVAYTNLQGAGIDVAKIEQGTDFMAEVEIINPGTWGNYSEMALTQIFPSGWEIINTRLADVTSAHEEDIPDYKDIRDDRVYTHFKVNAHKNKKFVVLLNASYLGRFYLPAISCEAMYDNSIYARTPGKWVEVVIPGKK